MIGKIILMAALVVGIAQAGVEERVGVIRKWYAAIDGGKPVSTKKIKFDAGGEPFGGDMVIRHYPDGLASVTVDYTSGDHGGSTDHYYFRNGDVFFVFEVMQSWSFSADSTGDHPQSEDTRTENRYYYDAEGRCIRQLTRSATSKQADELAKILSKKKQTTETPDVAAEVHHDRAKRFLNATTGDEVMEILSEPGC